MDTHPRLADQAGPIRQGEELDQSRLADYLKSHLPEATGELCIEQFRAGHSNLTYLLRLGERELVLRRPPFGNPVKSAHDMGREYRVLSQLWKVYPPAPRPFLYCDDADVLGDEFYVMERRFGVVLRDGAPPPELQANPQMVRQLSEAVVDNLVQLHSLDFRAAGLADLGRPEGYIGRQVSGWRKRYENARTDDHADMDFLGRWLDESQPGDGPAALIHNDYKYDNIMLGSDDLTKIVAVLDWEMATLGDPLMDLGMALAYWVQEDDAPTQQQSAFGPTMLPGSLTRKEVVNRYAEQAGIEVPDMLFYYCFGLYKLAVIIQQIYARFVRGKTNDPRFAGMDTRVKALGNAGVAAIDAGDLFA